MFSQLLNHFSYLSEIKVSCITVGLRVSGGNYKVKYIKLRNS